MLLEGVAAQLYVLGVLVGAFVLFLWGRLRYDVVALMALLAIGLVGILPRERLFAGFAHPAVITVAAVLVLSRGLANAGLVDALVGVLARAGDRPFVHLVILTLIITVISGFMNNVGALALLLPVAIQMARRSGYPPSRILMPMAFGSLLGGLVTLIGTPPNIIIATFRRDAVGEPFRMFDFTPVGVLVAVAGLIVIFTLGHWLVPRREGDAAGALFKVEEYLTEVRVPEGSPFVGQTLKDAAALGERDILIAGVVRGPRRVAPRSGRDRVRGGDILIVEAEAEELRAWVEAGGLELVGSERLKDDLEGAEEIELQEAVVRAGSPLIDRSPLELRMRQQFGVNLLAVARQGARIKRRLAQVRFQPGDVLLVEGEAGEVGPALARMGLLPLAARDLRFGVPRRLRLAALIFLLGIGATALHLLPVEVAFAAAAGVMVLANIVPIRDVYGAIDWPIVFLIAGMIPVGEAMEVTGAAGRLAGYLLHVTAVVPPWGAVALLLIATMSLSDVVNNAAAAVLMAPIAISVAAGLGVSPDPFLMAVAIGASCAFLTPVGHQSNTLVMGPAGYHFRDYWRLGLAVEAAIVLVGVPAILLVWPL